MQINEQTFTYGIYVRKSSESEDRQVQSIERQRDDLMEVVERNMLSIFDIPIQESKSAFSTGREGFSRLVKLTKRGKIDAWLCWHANRLSRNPIDAGTIIDLMDRGLLKHIRTPSRVYENTPTDKMMLQIEFTMSKKDSDDKSLFVKSGLRKRYRKGLPTGKAPIGFINEKYKEQGDRGILVDEERLEKVRMIFKRFLKGNDSISSVVEFADKELNLATMPTKRNGHKPVGKSQMYNMLCDPIYAGFFYARGEDGNKNIRHELCDSLPRIITEDEHRRILNILSNRNIKCTQRHEKAYTGFIHGADGNYMGVEVKFQLICDCRKKFAYLNRSKCPSCSTFISSMNNPKYLEYVYYYNGKRRKNKDVIAKTVSESKVDQYLKNYFEENIYLPKEFIQWAQKYIEKLKDEEISHNQRLIKSYSEKKHRIEDEKKRLRELLRKGLITESEYMEDVDVLKTKLNDLPQTIRVDDWMRRLNEILNMSSEITRIIEKGDVKKKKALFDRIGLNLIWDEENLSISNAKWMEVFKKGRKSALAKFKAFEPENNVGNKRTNEGISPYRPMMCGWLDDVRTQYYKDYYNDLYGADNFEIFFV